MREMPVEDSEIKPAVGVVDDRAVAELSTSRVDLVTFAKPILINMENRPERLASSLAELRAVTGRPVEAGSDVHLIRPTRFTDPGGFANPGFRSNLDAHLRAARWAREAGHERVLVLEDDVAFNPLWSRFGSALLDQLRSRPWDLANLGFLDTWAEGPTAPDHPAPDHLLRDGEVGSGSTRAVTGWARFDGKVNGAHAYLLNRSILDHWITHLETVADGRPGDDRQGPMASDGALNTFFWIDPDRVRLLAVPNMVGTRPTRSDIDPGLIDRLPVVGWAAEVARRWLRRHRQTPAINYR